MRLRASGSVPEIQAVETLTFMPAVASVGKVHREIDMPAQGLGIAASDGRVFVEPSMVLGQFRPQHPASRIVTRRVVADNNAGRGCRARQFAVLHADRLPDPAEKAQRKSASSAPWQECLGDWLSEPTVS